MKTRQPNPIALRPRVGSVLDRIWNERKDRGQGMADLIHDWAERFDRSEDKEASQ